MRACVGVCVPRNPLRSQAAAHSYLDRQGPSCPLSPLGSPLPRSVLQVVMVDRRACMLVLLPLLLVAWKFQDIFFKGQPGQSPGQRKVTIGGPPTLKRVNTQKRKRRCLFFCARGREG